MVRLLDQNDVIENLTELDAASLSVKESETDEDALFTLDADLPTDLDVEKGTVIFHFTEENTSAFTSEGLYIADILLTVDSVKYSTDRFYVSVALPITSEA